jgi:hypothetical protein
MPSHADADAAAEAAMRVAHLHGMRSSNASVLQETNNVVVWLRPFDVVAKIGRRPHSHESLALEHTVAAQLAEVGAPIAIPLPGVAPIVDHATGFIVTLWQRIDVGVDPRVDPMDAARTLRVLHEHLDRYDGPLPDVRSHVQLARRALDDDRAMVALPAPDHGTLRDAIDILTERLGTFDFRARVLHGEPHLGNVLASADGPRWIDLEDVCVGPLEWDVAFLPERVHGAFEIDPALMGIARTLNSACVATWCWVRADLPGMLPHARHHLERVKAALLR